MSKDTVADLRRELDSANARIKDLQERWREVNKREQEQVECIHHLRQLFAAGWILVDQATKGRLIPDD